MKVEYRILYVIILTCAYINVCVFLPKCVKMNSQMELEMNPEGSSFDRMSDFDARTMMDQGYAVSMVQNGTFNERFSHHKSVMGTMHAWRLSSSNASAYDNTISTHESSDLPVSHPTRNEKVHNYTYRQSLKHILDNQRVLIDFSR